MRALGTQYTASGDAFVLTVAEPVDSEPPQVQGTLSFLPHSSAGAASVELMLFGQFKRERAGRPRLGGETTIAGCATSVQRGETPSEFALPLPLVAQPYDGEEFEIRVGVRATPDTGSALRVTIDVPSAAHRSRLILRGLPKRLPLAEPYRLWIGIGLCAAALLLLVVDVPLLRAGAGLLGTAGVLLTSFALAGKLGWTTLGVTQVTLASADTADGAELSISLPKAAGVARARARLLAAEFELDEGHTCQHGELFSSATELVEGAGELCGRLPLPEAGAAPPSLALRSGRTVLSIRWRVIVERESARGVVVRSTFPLAVGVAPREARARPAASLEA